LRNSLRTNIGEGIRVETEKEKGRDRALKKFQKANSQQIAQRRVQFQAGSQRLDTIIGDFVIG
jgi:hypothetical protein